MTPWWIGQQVVRWALQELCTEEVASRQRTSRARERWRETSHVASSLPVWLRLRQVFFKCKLYRNAHFHFMLLAAHEMAHPMKDIRNFSNVSVSLFKGD